MLAGDDLGARLRATDQDADIVVSRSVTAGEVVSAALAVADDAPGPEGESVLALDDDPDLLAALGAILEGTGIGLDTITDAHELLPAMNRLRPDLLLLDVDVAGVDGIALCEAVRSDVGFRSLPVVFLTARTDPATVQRVFEAGADDYVAKPVVGPELVTRVKNRLERVRLLRRLADTDQLTGVVNRRRSEVLVCGLLAGGGPVAVALVDLDHFKSVNDRFGHAVGDEVLRRFAAVAQANVRQGDVVSRWGGEEFVLALPGAGREEAAASVERLLVAFGDEHFSTPDGTTFTVGFSAGVALIPDDADDLRGAHRAADERLYRAKAAGRARVVS